MAELIELQVRFSPRLQAGLRNYPTTIAFYTNVGLDAAGRYIVGLAQENATTSPRVVTGRLRRSITVVRYGAWGRKIGPNVVYGAIQEFGGTIVPRRARRLVFRIGNRMVFAHSVTIREKRYMRNALEQGTPEAENILQKALVAAARECGYE